MESSINIVAVSPHWKEAIEAAGWAIDEVKKSVTIWKKEFYKGEDDAEAQWKKNVEFDELRK